MIRETEADDLRDLRPDSEASVKILGLVKAYGKQPFLHYWQFVEAGSCIGSMSLLDGAAVVAFQDENTVAQDVIEEAAAFLSMHPEIRTVRTSAKIGRRIAGENWKLETGTVMTPGEPLQVPRETPENLTPREIYPVLSECFGNEAPSFSPWYVDVSHRLRHGCCRIVGFRENGRPAACAMTTSECEGGALIGAVATLPICRGKGYASANVMALAKELMGEGRRVFLSPKNEAAHRLYSRIGFTDCGEWAGLTKINE